MSLRNWRAVRHNQDLGDVSGRRFVNELISGCKVSRVAGAIFLGCDLRGTEVAIDDIRDLVGVSLTLDCFSFHFLKLSPVATDGLLYLISLADIPQDKKDAIRALIPSSRLEEFETAFRTVE